MKHLVTGFVGTARGLIGTACLLLSLSACSPVTAAAGAGATLGVAAAQEGGITSAITDKAIYLKISDLWFKSSFEMYRKLTLNVKEGRVLIAGSLPTADMRVAAMRLAWQAEGVRQVINEITVDDGSGISGYVRDGWISNNIKARLVFDKHVQSINYNIEAVNGTVYVLGIAQDKKELDHVLDTARNTRYVKNVVSYARLRGEHPAGVQAPTTDTPSTYPPAGKSGPDTSTPPAAPDAVQSERLGPPA